MSRFPYTNQQNASYGGQPGSSFKMRLIIAAAIALFAIISYYGKAGDENAITGKSERVAMTEEAQEIKMGLQSAPEMAKMHGGPSRDAGAEAMVDRVGRRLLAALEKKIAQEGRHNPYHDNFHFTLLADPETVNAFALPGGQVFITAALFKDLDTEGQLAGVLGHEIGHVIERHSNKQMAKEQMFQGLAAAGGVAGGDVNSARMSQAVVQMVSMGYGRADELEADKWGVRLTYMAGYDPRAMIGVMEILDRATQGGGQPEILSTHPKPANRVKYIKDVIAQEFPEGIPDGMEK